MAGGGRERSTSGDKSKGKGPDRNSQRNAKRDQEVARAKGKTKGDVSFKGMINPAFNTTETGSLLGLSLESTTNRATNETDTSVNFSGRELAKDLAAIGTAVATAGMSLPASAAIGVMSSTAVDAMTGDDGLEGAIDRKTSSLKSAMNDIADLPGTISREFSNPSQPATGTPSTPNKEGKPNGGDGSSRIKPATPKPLTPPTPSAVGATLATNFNNDIPTSQDARRAARKRQTLAAKSVIA